MSQTQIDRIRMGVAAAALLATAIIYVALPFNALKWARQPFAGFVLDPNLVVNDAAEPGWPAKQLTPPIAYPEQVVAINGRAVSTNREFYDLLQTHAPGDQVTIDLAQPPAGLTVAPRADVPASRSVTLTLFSLGSSDLWNQFWLVYLVGLLFLAIGAWTFAVRPTAHPAQLFAIFTALAALTAGNLFDLVTTQAFVRAWPLALSLVGSTAAMLAFVFPLESRAVVRRPWLPWLVLLPGLAVAIWGQVWLYHGPDDWAYALPWRIAYLVNAIGLLLAVGTTLYRSVSSSSALVRQQGQIILLGALLGFGPLILVFLKLAFVLPWDWLTQGIYVPPVILYPLAIGYTIIRYRLLDTNVMLRRGLPAVLAVGALIGGLSLIFSGLTTALGPDTAVVSPLVIGAIILLTLLVADPLRERLQQQLDHLLFAQPVAFDELLRTFNRELTTAVRVPQVTDILRRCLQTAVPQATPHLYLLDDLSGEYVCQTRPAAPAIPPDSPLIPVLRREPNSLELIEERTWPAALRAHPEAVRPLEAAVLAPMNKGEELLGWLALSAKRSQQPFSTTELNFLSALADQAVIGLERASTVSRLEARIAEQDSLSRFSQALNFTIVFDDMLELVYTNFYRGFGVEAFTIGLVDTNRGHVYPVFFLEDGERYPGREGRQQRIDDPRVRQVVQTGQPLEETAADGMTWIAAPLNAGADTLGVICATCREPLRPRQQQLLAVYSDRTAVALDRLLTNLQLKTRAQQLEIINEVTLTLASTPDLDLLLNLILDKAIELLDTEAGTFMLSHEDTGELEFVVVRGPTSQALLGTRLPIGTGLSGRVAQSGRPEIVNRVQDDERWFSRVDAGTEFESRSILTVPLIRQNTVSGVLQVINKRDGALFDEEDQQMLMAFASQAVVAMENARLLRQTDQALQSRVNELFLLQQLDRDLNTTLNIDRILSLTLDWSLRICGGSAGIVALLDDGGAITQLETRGYDASFDWRQLGERKLTGGLIGRVVRTGRPHVTGNVHDEPDYVAGAAGTHSQLTLPIVQQDRLIGVISVESDRFDAFDPEMLETAVRVSTHAGVAITNAILYQQVIDANEAKSEFVSMVSHELKTPMTSIRGYADLMLSGMTGELNAQQRSFLEKIAANLQRMSRQIRDLTDISRIETNQLMIVMQPTPFPSIISETLPVVQGLCDAKEIALQLALPPDLPLVMGDKERLVQVMTNLLSNACKYSPRGSQVSVTLQSEIRPSADGAAAVPAVVCAVRDTGYGISEADQRQLFTKFFRSEDPDIRQAPGTGLGLSITKGIVELHGGQITVESQLGAGTCFTFWVPQAPG
ncbi:MAG: GAF domain-containing protein [Anaerolineales bacterium]|nr:GAF domain-containing protein [Anaerolineales bacterium]